MSSWLGFLGDDGRVSVVSVYTRVSLGGHVPVESFVSLASPRYWMSVHRPSCTTDNYDLRCRGPRTVTDWQGRPQPPKNQVGGNVTPFLSSHPFFLPPSLPLSFLPFTAGEANALSSRWWGRGEVQPKLNFVHFKRKNNTILWQLNGYWHSPPDKQNFELTST